MKIVVIGLGSMGKRRIRLLSERNDITIVGVDTQMSRRDEAKIKFGIESYESIAEACSKNDIDAAVISTSPLSHAAIINECLERDLHVFTEINLVSTGYDDNIQLAKEKGKILFLSSTFLYQDDTLKIIEKIKESSSPVNYIYHVGQYLPDWHPWESYNDYFIGDPRTNGCREIMAIELPWIYAAFGPVVDMNVMKSKNTSLQISYNDNYLILLEHESGAKGVFCVDVVSRNPIRNLEITGEDIHLFWKGTVDSLSEYNIKNKRVETIDLQVISENLSDYADFIDENPYRKELESYIAQINDPRILPVWDFIKDKEVLDLIDRIESL